MLFLRAVILSGQAFCPSYGLAKLGQKHLGQTCLHGESSKHGIGRPNININGNIILALGYVYNMILIY